MSSHPQNSQARELRQRLNAQTGRLAWTELQRHFARGVVVVVEPELDLVEAAARMAENDQRQIQAWGAQGRIRRASDQDARRWNARDTGFWAVVVAPWVLVQELVGGR